MQLRLEVLKNLSPYFLLLANELKNISKKNLKSIEIIGIVSVYGSTLNEYMKILNFSSGKHKFCQETVITF